MLVFYLDDAYLFGLTCRVYVDSVCGLHWWSDCIYAVVQALVFVAVNFYVLVVEFFLVMFLLVNFLFWRVVIWNSVT
jgi:hypothetical protein